MTPQATGVVGKHGYGTAEHFGIRGQVDIYTTTFNKGLGCHGAAIISTADVIEYIRYHARPYVLSTAMSPVTASCVHTALDVMEQESWRIKQLRENILYLARELKNLNFNIGNFNLESAVSANVRVILNNIIELRLMSRSLHEDGIWVNAVEYPAVPINNPMFRIGLMATHTREDLDQALEAFRRAGKSAALCLKGEA